MPNGTLPQIYQVYCPYCGHKNLFGTPGDMPSDHLDDYDDLPINST